MRFLGTFGKNEDLLGPPDRRLGGRTTHEKIVISRFDSIATILKRHCDFSGYRSVKIMGGMGLVA